MGEDGTFGIQFCLIGTIAYPVSYQNLLRGSYPRSLKPSQGLSWWEWGEGVEIRKQGRISRGRKLDTALWKPSMWETAGCINLNFVIPGTEKAHPVYTERIPKWNFHKVMVKNIRKVFWIKAWHWLLTGVLPLLKAIPFSHAY